MEQTTSEQDAQAVKEQNNQPAQPKLWSFFFVLLIVSSFGMFLANQGFSTGLAVYVSKIGDTAAYAGFLGFTFSIVAGFTRIGIGYVLDRTFAPTVAIIGAVCFAALSLLLAFLGQGVAFTIVRTVQGVAFASATTSITVAAEEILPRERLGEGIGYFGLSQAIGMALGPSIALVLVNMDPPTNLFSGLALSVTLGAVSIALCRYNRHLEKLPVTAAYRVAQEKGQAVKHSQESQQSDSYTGISRLFEFRALPGAASAALFFLVNAFFMFFIAQYGVELGVQNTGLIFVFDAVAMATVRFSAGVYMDKVNPRVIILISTILVFLSFLLLSQVPFCSFFYYLAGFVYGMGYGVVQPLCQAISVKPCPHNRWGAATALFFIGVDVGMGIGGVLWGAVLDAFGYGVCFWWVEAVLVLSCVVAWFIFPRKA